MVNRTADLGTRIHINPSKNEGRVPVTTTEEVSLIQEVSTVENSKESFKEDLSASKVKKMTESLNDFLETTSTKLRYEFHEKLEKYYVTLVDSETDQIVREIPNKKLMDMYASMLDFIGVLIDKKI